MRLRLPEAGALPYRGLSAVRILDIRLSLWRFSSCSMRSSLRNLEALFGIQSCGTVGWWLKKRQQGWLQWLQSVNVNVNKLLAKSI